MARAIVKTLSSKVKSIKSIDNTDYIILDTDGYDTILVTTGASQRTVSLPPPSTNIGREITIKKVDSDAGTVLLDTPGSETIDNTAAYTLNKQHAFITLTCDGFNWNVNGFWDKKTRFTSNAVGYSTNISGGVNAITLSPGKPTIPSTCLVTITLSFRYINQNGTNMQTNAIAIVKDGATNIGIFSNFIQVGSGYNDIITRSWSTIIDYPVGALTVAMSESNTGGGTYLTSNAHGTVTVTAVRLT